jgi:glycosyltransferase involved in cell wall biosynthesis
MIPALVSLAEELSRRHAVHVFAFGGPGPVTHDRIGGAEVHQLGDPATIDPPRRARNLRLLARLARQLEGELAHASRARPFQVLHAFWANEPGVRFRGHLPNPELAPFYRDAHLQVVSSRYESQSLAVLEAAAAALPTEVGLLATMAPAAAAVVAPGDAEGLAHAIAHLLGDEAERRTRPDARCPNVYSR